MGMSNNATINNLKSVIREDGSVDVEKNPWNICTVEGEFDRAMRAEGDEERKDPVGYAIRQLASKWQSKSNRFSSSYSYGDMLQFYMKHEKWAEIKAKMEEKGLANLEQYEHAHNIYVWSFRLEMVRDRPRLARTMVWFPFFKKNEDLIRAICKDGV